MRANCYLLVFALIFSPGFVFAQETHLTTFSNQNLLHPSLENFHLVIEPEMSSGNGASLESIFQAIEGELNLPANQLRQ